MGAPRPVDEKKEQEEELQAAKDNIQIKYCPSTTNNMKKQLKQINLVVALQIIPQL